VVVVSAFGVVAAGGSATSFGTASPPVDPARFRAAIWADSVAGWAARSGSAPDLPGAPRLPVGALPVGRLGVGDGRSPGPPLASSAGLVGSEALAGAAARARPVAAVGLDVAARRVVTVGSP
jgi:hypothetical protein